MTEQTIDIAIPTSLPEARNWLQYARRSSPPNATFTVNHDIVQMFGSVKQQRASAKEGAKRAFLRYALAVANDETDRSEMEQAILARRAGRTGGVVERIDSTVSPNKQAEDYSLGIEQQRQRLRDFMELVLTDRSAAAKTIDAQDLEHVWSIPELSGGVLRHHLIVLDLAAFNALVGVLLVSKEFGGDLRKCGLVSCNRFFFRERTKGRSRDRYCDAACYKLAHNAKLNRSVAPKRHK